jgi:hypothetical protein
MGTAQHKILISDTYVLISEFSLYILLVRVDVHNFNLEGHLVDRQTYKIRRSAALPERQNLVSQAEILKDVACIVGRRVRLDLPAPPTITEN